MIKPIIKDQQLLAKKATPTTKADLPLANDLSDTLNIHQAECVGMAANMIPHLTQESPHRHPFPFVDIGILLCNILHRFPYSNIPAHR